MERPANLADPLILHCLPAQPLDAPGLAIDFGGMIHDLISEALAQQRNAAINPYRTLPKGIIFIWVASEPVNECPRGQR